MFNTQGACVLFFFEEYALNFQDIKYFITLASTLFRYFPTSFYTSCYDRASKGSEVSLKTNRVENFKLFLVSFIM